SNLTMDVTGLLDTMVTLECEVRGVPHPTITWFRRGEAVMSSRHAQYVDRGLRLKIPHVQASDAGQHSHRKCKLFISRWYKDGKQISSGEGLRISASGRRLIVSRAQMSDTARFQCLATNEAGDHERNFNVTVQEPPSIPLCGDIINQTVLSGFSTELECKASGSPLPGKTDRRCPPPHCCGHSQPAVLISSCLYLSLKKEGQ
ncbi:hypothetical protein XENOCAPTIV_019822, partial [Xenoophorus captivus]